MASIGEFTAATYRSLSPEWQAEARRLIARQGRLIVAAEECACDDEAQAIICEFAVVSAKLDSLTRLLVN